MCIVSFHSYRGPMRLIFLLLVSRFLHLYMRANNSAHLVGVCDKPCKGLRKCLALTQQMSLITTYDVNLILNFMYITPPTGSCGFELDSDKEILDLEI